VTVVVAELFCLLPKIFPKIDPSADNKRDGGATGVAGVLWPLCFIAGHIPTSIANTLIERSVKTKIVNPSSSQASLNSSGYGSVSTEAQQHEHKDSFTPRTTSDRRSTGEDEPSGSALGQESSFPSEKQLNMIYYLTMFQGYYTVFTVLMFWTDCIPGLGTTKTIAIFWARFKFNLGCLFGAQGCSAYVIATGWAVAVVNMLGNLSIGYLLRYSEGANYMVVAKTLKTPTLFLFWSLFTEFPHLQWNPHIVTWISFAALFLMVPAIYLYTTGPPEVEQTPHERSLQPVPIEGSSERTSLLA